MIADRDNLRLRKQAERDSRIDGLYEKDPRLRKIDEELAEAGKEGLLRVYEGGGAEAARQKINRLQADKKKILTSLGTDESVYDVAWDCPLCQDRGYIYPGEPCGCLRQNEGLRLAADSGLSPLQKKQTFDNFSLEWYTQPDDAGKLADQVKSFTRELILGRPCGNLFLFGPVGNGKTHLCSAAANEVLAAGKSVFYGRAEGLVEALREEIYGRGDYPGRGEPRREADQGEEAEGQAGTVYGKGLLQNRLLQTDLLILEDLGAERLTDFAEEQLINIIDGRINWQKPWIITSHLIGEKFTGRYDPRLVDRVLGEGKRLYLNENSIRFKKTQKNNS